MRRRQALLAVALPLSLLVLCASSAYAIPLTIRVLGDHELVIRDSALRSDSRVHVTVRDLDITADFLTFPLAPTREQIAEFWGRVVLRAPNQTYRGERLLVNLTAGTWEFTEVAGELDPAFFPQGVIRPVYVGAQVVGVGADGQPFVHQGSLTTCDLPDPHWEIRAREVVIEPGRRIIARRVSFYVSGRRVLTLSRWIINLDAPRRQPLVPTVGSSEPEGVFLKTAVPYELSDRSFGNLRFDLMSRRGVGFGFDHFWYPSRGALRLSLRQVDDSRTGFDELTGRLDYVQALGERTTLRLFADERRGTFLFNPEAKARHARLSLEHTGASSSTRVSLDYTRMRGFQDRETFQTELVHERQLGSLSLSIAPQYRSIDAVAGFPADEEVRTRLQLRAPSRTVDLALLFDRQFDVDADAFPLDSTFDVVERLPELVAVTSLERLGIRAPFGLPLQFTASVGRFTERASASDTDRAMIRLDTPTRQYPLLGGTLTLGAGFRQTVYDEPNPSAQYLYQTTLGWEHPLGRGDGATGWTLALDYHLLKSKGFTPFRFDFAGNRELAAAGVQYRSPRTELLLGTGFDAQNDRWQNLFLRARHDFGRGFVVTTTAGFDFNLGQPLDLLTRVQRRYGAFSWGLSTRLDLETGALRRAAAELDWTLGAWRFRALSGWNGKTNRFFYNEFLVSRDLHCWELLIYYSDQRRDFRVDLRLKAFHFGPDRFGTGRFGQRTDTNIGERY